jgi:hypothetical protein
MTTDAVVIMLVFFMGATVLAGSTLPMFLM